MINVKKLIEDHDTWYGKSFDLFIQFLIVLSIITFSIETIPTISAESRRLLRVIEIVCVLIFTAEYITRIIVSDNKWKFIFSFYGIIDILAILPFYVATGIDLRALRAVRLLRLIKIFRLGMYSKAAKRFYLALSIAKEELVLYVFISLILVFFSAMGIYYFEREVQPDTFSSVFESLWWAIVTLTTVGYGDVYPLTMGGRIFTFFVLIIGLAFIAFPTGLIASALARAREMEDEQ
jgi:voltage-gated potassium channel